MIKFVRSCPSCNCDIHYSRIYDLNNAEIKKSLCRLCRNRITSHFRKKEKIKHLRIKYKCQIDSEFFKQIDSKEKAYWLGYICADGHINKNLQALSLASKDKERIEKFREDIKATYKINNKKYFDKRYNKEYEIFSLVISRKNMVKDIIHWGVTNNKTDILEMPNIEEKYYSYFFAGLFDGDGSILEQNKNNKLYYNLDLISTKEMLEFLQQYLIKNFSFSKTKIRKIKSKNKNLYHIGFSKFCREFLQWIYQDDNFSYMKRKYEKYQIIKKGEQILCQIKSR